MISVKNIKHHIAFFAVRSLITLSRALFLLLL